MKSRPCNLVLSDNTNFVGTKTEEFLGIGLLHKTGIEAVVDQTFILLSLTVTLADLINFFYNLTIVEVQNSNSISCLNSSLLECSPARVRFPVEIFLSRAALLSRG